MSAAQPSLVHARRSDAGRRTPPVAYNVTESRRAQTHVVAGAKELQHAGIFFAKSNLLSCEIGAFLADAVLKGFES
jgi:hypothetical protein